jgi:hypothetical protein
MNASGRLNTCKSWGSRGVAIRSLATGKRVRNTYTTFLKVGDSPGKPGLIPRNIMKWHHFIIIAAMRLKMGVRLIRQLAG